jgi:hypothetical protein
MPARRNYSSPFNIRELHHSPIDEEEGYDDELSSLE